MLRKLFFILLMAFVSGCGDEGLVPIGTHPDSGDNAPAAPSWQPDAITMDELIYPYVAKHAVGIHTIAGETFVLAACEVLYKSRRVRQSERDNRWVRIGNGRNPQHATHWTHNRIPQFLYIFLNFDNEADYQRFGIGTHQNVRVQVVDTYSLGANTWELKLKYQSSVATDTTPIGTQSQPAILTTVGDGNLMSFSAVKESGYFFEGSARLDGFTLTGIAYNARGLTLRSENGFTRTPGRIVITQRSTGERNFGRRITFGASTVRYSTNYAYIHHVNLSQEQSQDLRTMGGDIAVGDVFHVYVFRK